MTTQPRIIRFLQRPGAKETWRYERMPFLLVELLCLLAGIWAAPTAHAKQLLAIALPLALWGAELGRAARSGAARKAEIAAAMGVPSVKLACERQLEQTAKNMQLVTATAPIVALVMSVANSSGVDATRAAVVGAIVFIVRWGMVEAMGAWRKWYREHVPVRIAVTMPQPARLVATATEIIKDGIATGATANEVSGKLHAASSAVSNASPVPLPPLSSSHATIGEVREQIERDLREKQAARDIAQSGAASSLAPTSPYQSAQLARMAEQILQAKESGQ